MRRKLCIVLLLFILSLEAANNSLGAGPVRLRIADCGQGQALPLQFNSSQEFMLAALKPDGVARAQTRRRRRHRQRRRLRTKSGGLSNISTGATGNTSVEPEVGAPKGAPPAEPTVGAAPSAAPPAKRAKPPIDVSRPGAPKPNSAPGIKPPTVQIKPPTR